MNPALVNPSLPLPSLVCHLNLTGRNVFKNSSPAGRSTISVLSLPSERELIEVSLQRRVEILLSPKVISFDTVALLASEPAPIHVLLDPVVILSPACLPKALLLAAANLLTIS